MSLLTYLLTQHVVYVTVHTSCALSRLLKHLLRELWTPGLRSILQDTQTRLQQIQNTRETVPAGRLK